MPAAAAFDAFTAAETTTDAGIEEPRAFFLSPRFAPGGPPARAPGAAAPGSRFPSRPPAAAPLARPPMRAGRWRG